MSAGLESFTVRAAGLAGRLLTPEGRHRILGATDLPTLARELSAAGYPSAEARPDAPSLELAVRRGASARLRQLARWDPEGRLGPLLFADEDRRSLRAVLRGAVAELSPEARLAGTLPTPRLPERALAELARQPSVAAIAALLAVWRSPYAEPLAAALEDKPDLLELEVALGRRIAADQLRAAGRDPGWRDFVQESIDLDNLRTALILAGRGDEIEPAHLFMPGGAVLTAERFANIARAPDAATGYRLAASAWAGTALAAPVDRGHIAPLALEPELEDLRRRAWRRRARGEPLGAAPVVYYLLRLRAEVRLLQRVVWGLALGAPPARRRDTEDES